MHLLQIIINPLEYIFLRVFAESHYFCKLLSEKCFVSRISNILQTKHNNEKKTLMIEFWILYKCWLILNKNIYIIKITIFLLLIKDIITLWTLLLHRVTKEICSSLFLFFFFSNVIEQFFTGESKNDIHFTLSV